MKLSTAIVSLSVALFGCHSPKESTLPISNSGIRFHMQMDLPRVFIAGDTEKNILRMETPPLARLLQSLDDQNKWKAAHVLLSFRYEKNITGTIDDWNGMNFWAMPDDEKEMKKVSVYWHNKYEHGQLVKASPPFPEELIDSLTYTPPMTREELIQKYGPPEDLFEDINKPTNNPNQHVDLTPAGAGHM